MENIPFEIEGYRLVRSRGDRDFVIDCMKEAVLGSVSGDEKELSELWIGDIMKIVSNNLESGGMDNEVFELLRDNDRVGLLWMGRSKDQFTCDDTGYLLGIHVREDMRRKGLGKGLVRAGERWCSAKGLLSMTLNVGVVNRGAVRLYDSLGYQRQTMVMRKVLKG